jgi:hypothetical protein
VVSQGARAATEERTSFETRNTLMSLLLLKLNELARYCSAPYVMSTAPRQSWVGDLLAHFRHTGSGGRRQGRGTQVKASSTRRCSRNRADSGTHLPDANASVTYAGSISPGTPLTMTRGDEALSRGHIKSHVVCAVLERRRIRLQNGRNAGSPRE